MYAIAFAAKIRYLQMFCHVVFRLIDISKYLLCKVKNSESKARIFLLVDLRDFFRSKVGGSKNKIKKSSENDQLNGHFQSFFDREPPPPSKTSKVNRLSVLNL